MRKRYEMQGAEKDPLEDFKNAQSHKRKNSIHSVSTVVGFLFIAVLLGIFGVIYHTDDILPMPLYIADEQEHPDAFITERARQDLKVLTDLGPRIVGSYENEALAVDFFKRQVTLIQHDAHKNQQIELDIQTVSGSYYLDFKPHGATNSYGKVQNIAVKLHSKNNSKHSLLVNAHFDSVPTSPGGSDDGINCVTMLEVLRKLSRLPDPPLHNIIFLFNGAEETPLQAAHGFITQHKWANEVGVVINLEAAGAGGKEILFQAGPGQPWLLNYYKKVPHPNAQVAGEELFQGGVIPSDTDFRLFRDFGNTIGLDLAFVKNGYRYHTKFDGFANIPLGTFQHVGDNVLSLIRNLGNAPELSDPKSEPMENFVFYDYLGLFIIAYSETVTIIINLIVSVISTAIAVKSFYDIGFGLDRPSLKYLGLTMAAIVLGWLAAGLFVVITGFILDVVNFSLSWYKNTWILLGLYALPTIFCCCGLITIFNQYFNKDNLSISVQTQIQAHLVRVIWTLPLFIGTFAGIRSVYIIFMPILFQTITAAIIMIFNLQHSVRKWQIIYILGTIIPMVFHMKLTLLVMGFFVPICGRIGSDRNPEFIIGALTIGVTVLITSYCVPLITLVRKPSMLLGGLFGIFVLFFIVVFTPLGFPYSGNPVTPAPERFWIYHTSRIFRNDTNDVYKKDSGFFMLNMDRNSPNSVKKYLNDLSNIKSIAEDCKNTLFCGLPISSSRMIPILPESTWIPAEQPILLEPVGLNLNSKTGISDTVTRFNFTASGPSQLTMYISPRAGVKLIKSTLIPEIETNPVIWNGRPVYIILYSWGKESTPLEFSLDFEMRPNWAGPALDIALTGTYKHDRRNVKTPHFKQFLSEFPNWADVTAWLGAYESWVY